MNLFTVNWKEIKTSSLFYFDGNGNKIKIGDNFWSKVIIDPFGDGATISITLSSVNITFHQLKYNDKFVFLCVGESAHAGFKNPQSKNGSLVIQNLLGIY